jgi:hypothetical protein
MQLGGMAVALQPEMVSHPDYAVLFGSVPSFQQVRHQHVHVPHLTSATTYAFQASEQRLFIIRRVERKGM